MKQFEQKALKKKQAKKKKEFNMQHFVLFSWNTRNLINITVITFKTCVNMVSEWDFKCNQRIASQ